MLYAMETAVRMETDAIKFYTEAAAKTKHPAGKKMFDSIVVDERQHLETVKRMLQGMKLPENDTSEPGKITTVFESLRDEMMEKVEATEDELEAFRIAMTMEKEGLEFYTKTSAEAESDWERDLFRRLADEEQVHYKIFANTYNFLNDTGNWFMWEERSIVEG